MLNKNIKTGYPHIDKPWMSKYDSEKVSTVNPSTNLMEYIRKKNQGHEGYIAETYYGNEVSYSQLYEEVDNASRVLTELGVKFQDRIMNLVPNIVESGQIWLGATQIGAVSDFIDPRPDSMDLQANANKVLELIKCEKSQYIIALDICYLHMLKPIENQLKDLGIQKIVTISPSDFMSLTGTIDYLKDVIQYNRLKNLRISNQTFQKLNSYQVIFNKLRLMKKNSNLYKEAVSHSPLEVLKYKDLVRECAHVSFQNVREGNILNYIGHTSGTSGARPKPITLTNSNQISGTEQLFKAGANFQPGDRVLHELPFFSPLGADNNFILNLASGSNNIEVPEFEINEFGYLVKKYHPNVILGTPAWLAALPNCSYLDDEDLSCITRIIYGGDSMSKEDEETVNIWLKKHGSSAEVEKGHGMSEYCGCGSYAQKEWNEYESIGIPLPDTIYTIVDPNVEDRLVPLKLEEGEEWLTGELAVSSPAVTNGILDGQIIVPHFELDGHSYIRTRDLVKMRKDGIFKFDSRKDRSFTRFDGYKVKPYEIESVIESHEKVKYCRIVQYFDDAQRGLMPIAHIVLEDDSLSENKKIQIIEEIVYKQIIANPTMSSRQIPSKFKIRKSLPLSKNSKVDFNALISEGIDGSEITVDVEETNLEVGNIQIYGPTKRKEKKLVKSF